MIITKEQLREVRVRHSMETIGFATGAYHLIHPGHVYFLNKCKDFCDVLVVAVAHDEITRFKRSTVINTKQRAYMVDNVRSVDYTLSEDGRMPPKNIEGIVKRLQPDVWITGMDNPNLQKYSYVAKHNNVRMFQVGRFTEDIFNISTTEIIRRLRHGYDKR